MSTNTKKINDLLEEQQAILNSIKAEALEFDSDHLAKQNEELTTELSQVSSQANSLKTENERLKKELDKTKSVLFTKLTQEKLSVFERRQRALEEIYYQKNAEASNKLSEYSKKCIDSINETIKTVESYGSAEFDDILKRLEELKTEAIAKKNEVDAFKAEQLANTKNASLRAGNELRNEPLTDFEKSKAQKQKSLESFIGLNVLSKAGILLFIVGIIMLGRFAYTHMSDTLKGGLIYLLSFALIAIGELFHKKENTVFSTTLISGGVATLYAACATGYFAFHIYGAKITFLICIVVTAIAITLSNQIKSQIVCAFAGIGGYLPVVAIYLMGFGQVAVDKTILPVSCVYFCVLAIIIFIMTYNKKWHIAQFIGYGLSVISIGGIAKFAYTFRNASGFGFATELATLFAVASFVIYLLMPATKIIKGKALSVGDSVLLALNTVSGAISVSLTVQNCFEKSVVTANRITGFVFLAFALIYVVLMTFSVKEKKAHSTVPTIITSISALLFSMTVVPLVFGIEYSAIGWVAEGVILAIISIEKGLKPSEYAGLLCMIMSIPVAYVYSGEAYSVLSIVTFSIILSCFWIYSVRGIESLNSNHRKPFVYCLFEILCAFASVGYIYYLYSCVMHSPYINFNCTFTDFAVVIIGLLLTMLVIRNGIFKNTASVIVSDITGVAVLITTFVCDIICPYKEITNFFYENTEIKSVVIINIILLIVINIASALFFSLCTFDIINRLNSPAWVYTMALSISTLSLITAILLAQFELKFSSIVISAVYLAIACLLLFIGFRKNYTVVRSSGLVLILCSFAKLCFVDTSHLDSGWKIASYFAFGALLIIISFFYQRFTKKIQQ